MSTRLQKLYKLTVQARTMESDPVKMEAIDITEELVLECTGEAHLGEVDSLLLRGRGLVSLESLKTLNMPSLQARRDHFAARIAAP